MSRIVAIIGGILATLAALIVGWKKAGEGAAEAHHSEKKYKEAAQLVERMSSALPGSKPFALAARDALRKRRLQDR